MIDTLPTYPQHLHAPKAARWWKALRKLTGLRGAAAGAFEDTEVLESRRPESNVPPQAAGATSAASVAAPPAGPPSSAFDSAFDSLLDADQLGHDELDDPRRQLLLAVHRGLGDPGARAVTAGYGAEGTLRFDFRARLVTCDAPAEQRLRSNRELPMPMPTTRPQPRYVVRELDQIAWDLGLAAAEFDLLGSPVDWWHAPLRAVRPLEISRFTRAPRHLELARGVAEGVLTPSQLRRHARVGVMELRGFLQAALMVGLLRWAATDANRGELK